MLNHSPFEDRNDAQDAENVLLAHLLPQPFAVVPPTDITVGGDSGDADNDACRLVRANLAAYQDNELDPDQRHVVEAHLGKCPECAAGLESLRTTDARIEREWRDCAPLPSSLQFKQSVDSIMAALPPVPVAPAAFAPKRVHSRGRWMRFSAGLAGLFAFVSMLWSSYRLGYEHGRMSLTATPQPAPTLSPRYRHSFDTRLIPILYSQATPLPSKPPERASALSSFHSSMQIFAHDLP